MKFLHLVLIAVAGHMHSISAATSEDVSACISAVKVFSGRDVDEFDVAFEDNWIFADVASWDGVQCHVSNEKILQLTIDDVTYVIDGFAGEEAKTAFDAMKADTDEAVTVLETRIQLLKERLETAKEDLGQKDPDITGASAFIAEGIKKSGVDLAN